MYHKYFVTLLSVSSEPLGPGHSVEYKESDKMYLWKIKKLDGGTEEQLVMKVKGINFINVNCLIYS